MGRATTATGARSRTRSPTAASTASRATNAAGRSAVAVAPPSSIIRPDARGTDSVGIPFRDDDGNPVLIDWERVAFDPVEEDEFGETLGDSGRGPEYSRRAVVKYADDLYLVVTVTTGAVLMMNWENEFDDDPLAAGGFGPNDERIRVRRGAQRATLIRPRTHFIPELLKSVENL